MERVYIPKHIDKPGMVLFWSVEEVAVITLMVCIGMAVEQVFILMCLSLFAVKKYRKLNQQHAEGFYLHWLYYKGVLDQGTGRTVPKVAIKEYLA
ncbi:hypothetical protein A3715_38110 [Oleiphilus sp. HI0009]|nr:hypothetical protein A3715_15675 [Oleiphilus sp. HI0009]KZX80203.1 hypothetical protein A3715_38110 [Oleiphilus sp. HI0009]